LLLWRRRPRLCSKLLVAFDGILTNVTRDCFKGKESLVKHLPDTAEHPSFEQLKESLELAYCDYARFAGECGGETTYPSA
jgi:hypothetical protein